MYALLAEFIVSLSACEINTHSHERIVFANAILYNQYIVVRHKELIEDIDIYNLAIEHDYSFAAKMLDSILIHSTQSLQDIQHMAPYGGDSSFGEVSADLFKYYSGKFIQEGKKVIELKEKTDSGNADNDEIKTLNHLAKKIDMHTQPLQTRLEEVQIRFARRNNFTLSPKENDSEEH